MGAIKGKKAEKLIKLIKKLKPEHLKEIKRQAKDMWDYDSTKYVDGPPFHHSLKNGQAHYEYDSFEEGLLDGYLDESEEEEISPDLLNEYKTYQDWENKYLLDILRGVVYCDGGGLYLEEIFNIVKKENNNGN